MSTGHLAKSYASQQHDHRLTSVKVDFIGKRPDAKLRLVVTSGEKDYPVEIGKDGPVEWEGNIPCSATQSVLIQLYYRKKTLLSRRWEQITAVQVQATLTEDVRPICDAKRRVNVTPTFSTIHGEGVSVQNATQDGSTALVDESARGDARTREVMSKLGAAKAQVEKKEVIIDKLGKIWAVVDILKSAGEALSDIHPAIGAASSALGFLTQACENQKSCRDEALDLIEQLDTFLSIEGHVQELKERKESRRAVARMLDLVTDVSDYICTHTSSGIIGDLFRGEYTEKISNLKAEFSRAKASFDRSIQLEIFKAVHGIEWVAQLGFLHEKLYECEDAHFKSGDGNVCLDGTRVDLRERAVGWFGDSAAAHPAVFWLHGKAGSGKSTVANTVAQTVEDRSYYLSCFFCKRDDENLSNPRRLLPTLAYRFAQQHDSYRAAIFQLLHSGTRGAGIATTADVNTQFERLFKEPLSKTVDPLQPHVIVIDALDECGSPRDQTSLAKCILALSRAAQWIKVFVTSRDEPGIRRIFSQGTECIPCNINKEEHVDDDIRLYILMQVQDLDFQLAEDDIRQLVRRAEGLFIWCSTLFKYLSTRLAPRDALQPFLSGSERSGSLDQLYKLYDKILDSALEDPDDVSFMRSVLAIIDVAAGNRPLSAKAIPFFLRDHELHKGRSEEHVRIVVKKLHAVLYVDESMDAAIRAYHSSFYDFLEQKARNSPGWEKPGAIHRNMFRNSLVTMHAQLRFNICKIDVPVLNKDIPDLAARIMEYMSEELQYSSRFWFTHVSPSNVTEDEAQSMVFELLCTKMLLFWLESLSLLGSLGQSLLAFQECARFFKEYPTITEAANDTRRFVTSFAEAMDCVPHIYLSALFWLPENSRTCENMAKAFRIQHQDLIKDKNKNWDAIVWERATGKGLYSVAFSPDGRFVTSGAHDGCLYIWDAQTGAIEGEPLRGHSEEVQSVAYSPDGRFIASGSRDDTVRIWDLQMGVTINGPLEGHCDDVICVAYSPDGLFVVSGSDDHTIRIWDAQTGAMVGDPLRGHSGGVWAVKYSSDGQFIASGGFDRDIHIWSTRSHAAAREPLQGHQEEVQSVTYSPDGSFIASGSRDRTIRIWDAQMGTVIGQPLRGHSDWVWSVMYSPDGRFIISSSRDFTIRIWDAQSGAAVGQPLRGHSDWVRSIAYSPDGRFVASASSDNTTRVWDTQTGMAIKDPLQGHSERVHSVAYSPDGQFIASGSRDAIIHIWDAHTGAAVGEPLRGHTDWVWSVAYSPDGHFIASGSADCTVRIWDIQTGTGTEWCGPLQGHSKSVLFVAYSPDGRYIASCSGDSTICIWNAQTGIAVGKPLQGHSDGVWSIAYSPDGRLLASGSSDGTIRLWDAQTGASVGEPFRGHSSMVRSVAFSPDGHYIASGSSDHSVRIWDVQRSVALSEPLQGHTDGVLCVVYSPDGRYIASSSCDCTIRVWDVQTGEPVGEPLWGHLSWVRSIVYSPDGRFLASGAEDMKTYVYDAPVKDPPMIDGSDLQQRWLTCCSRMSEDDGWVKDGETLLFWIPVPCRPTFRSCANVIISNHVPKVVVSSVDVETLFSYSGNRWSNVYLQ